MLNRLIKLQDTLSDLKTLKSPTPQELDPIIFQYIDEEKIWHRISKKTHGVNPSGRHGGFYELIANPKIKVFFKQDPVIAKNISEFVASKVMRCIAKEINFNPNSVAQVELAYIHPRDQPNRDGNNVYIASVIYPNFLELYKDAYLAFHCLPQYESLRKQYPELLDQPFPTDRPTLFSRDKVIDLMIQQGRYHGLLPLLHLSRSVDDPDVHLGNVGVIPANQDQQQAVSVQVDQQGKMSVMSTNIKAAPGTTSYMVFPSVDSVRIDFGAAFGDDRFIERTYDKNNANRGLLATLIAYHPSKKGPPPYAMKILSTLHDDQASLFWLNKIANCNSTSVYNAFKIAIDEVFIKFHRKPILEFAKRIGFKLSAQKEKDIKDEELKIQLVIFLSECFIHYQQSAKQYYSTHQALTQRLQPAEMKNMRSSVKHSEKNPAHIKMELYAKTIELLNKINNNDLTPGLIPSLQTLIVLRNQLLTISDKEILNCEDALRSIIKTHAKLITQNETESEIQKLQQKDQHLIEKVALISYAGSEGNQSLLALELMRLTNSIEILPDDISLYFNTFKLMQIHLQRCLKNQNHLGRGAAAEDDLQLIRSLNQLSSALFALKAYRDALENSKHCLLCLKKERSRLLNLRYEEVNNLVIQLSQNKVVDLERATNHITEATTLIRNINQLKAIIDIPRSIHKFPPLEQATQRIYKSAQHLFDESGKSAIQLLIDPIPDFNQTQLLSETLIYATEAVRHPLDSDVQRLKMNAKELEGKSVLKKIAGFTLMVAGAVTALAATVLVVSEVFLANATFGMSLLGVPASYWLFGASVSLFSSGAGLLFSGRQKQIAKATSKMVNSLEARKNVDQKPLTPRV